MKQLKKGNLLFVSAHLPALKVPQAGQKIAYHRLKRYAEQYNVYLVTFVNEVEKAHLDSSDLAFCAERHIFPVSTACRVASALRNLFLPLRVSARASRAAARVIEELQGRVSFEVAHFEFTAAAQYLTALSQPAHTVITEHDVTFQSLERKRAVAKAVSRLLYGVEYARQKKWELALLHQADEVIVLCDKDRLLLAQEGVAPAKVRVQVPEVDPKYRQVVRADLEPHSMLYYGAMDRAENEDAVRFFCRDILPSIVRSYPAAKLYVVGANPTREIRALASAHVVVTGFIEDPLCYFASCQVAVAPLRMGAGIKIKVLECLEAGLPVVATSIGAEGIEHEKLLVADRAADFARVLGELFEEDLVETAGGWADLRQAAQG